MLVRRLTLFACMALGLVTLSGCETMRKTWKDTQEIYRTYVNVDPQVDLKAEGHADWEAILAPLVTPVDMQISELVRMVDGRDSFPDEAWTASLLKRFPWLTGMAATDMAGAVLLRKPESALKPLLMAPLVEAGDAWRDRRLRTLIEDTPLGPEIYVATPYFKDNALQGLIAAHFDMRSVVQISPDPARLMVVSAGVLLWAGGFGDAAGAVQSQPWLEMLKEKVRGEIAVQGRRFVWLARYIGDRQIVYLTELPPED